MFKRYRHGTLPVSLGGIVVSIFIEKALKQGLIKENMQCTLAIMFLYILLSKVAKRCKQQLISTMDGQRRPIMPQWPSSLFCAA